MNAQEDDKKQQTRNGRLSEIKSTSYRYLIADWAREQKDFFGFDKATVIALGVSLIVALICLALYQCCKTQVE